MIRRRFSSLKSFARDRLDGGWDMRVNLNRLRKVEYRRHWLQTSFLIIIATLSLTVLPASLPFKLSLLVAYTVLCLIPISSQFFLPATPILAWLLLFFSSQFIPNSFRPHIWVSVLPTLESVLYGANISDILTRYTNEVLDVMAWIPYGVGHFAAPFVVALSLWTSAPEGAVQFWSKAFGYMNLAGVLCQIVFPCAPPWYELRNGLTPANYSMSGSPGGLARIDALFHSSGYTKTFTSSPVVFGAFPSLHAACSTMEALFLSHFFPKGRVYYWVYVFWLYWSTMYLTHHYLVDLTAGGSLAVIFFFSCLPDDMRQLNSTTHTTSPSLSPVSTSSSRSSSMSEEGSSVRKERRSRKDRRRTRDDLEAGEGVALLMLEERRFVLEPEEDMEFVTTATASSTEEGSDSSSNHSGGHARRGSRIISRNEREGYRGG